MMTDPELAAPFWLSDASVAALGDEVHDFTFSIDLPARDAERFDRYVLGTGADRAGEALRRVLEEWSDFVEVVGPKASKKVRPLLARYVVERLGRGALIPIDGPSGPRGAATVAIGARACLDVVAERAEELGVPHALDVPMRGLPIAIRSNPAFVRAVVASSSAHTVGELLAWVDVNLVNEFREPLLVRVLAWLDEARALLLAEESRFETERTPLPPESPFGAADSELAALVARSEHGREWPPSRYDVIFEAASERLVVTAWNPASGQFMMPVTLQAWPSLGAMITALTVGAARALRRFFRDEGDRGRAALAAWSTGPRWERFFAHLDRAIALAPAPRVPVTDARVAFVFNASSRALALEVMVQKRTRSGWSPGSRSGTNRDRAVTACADAADRRVLEVVAVETRGDSLRFGLSRIPLARILDAMVGHPRIFVGDKAVAVRRVPVTIEFVDAADEAAPGSLEARVRVGRHTRTLAEVTILPEEPLVVDLVSDPSALAFGVMTHAAHRILTTFRDRPTLLPEAAWPDLIRRLEVLGAAVPAILPPSLEGEELAVPVTPVVELALDDANALTVRLSAQVRGHLERLEPGEGGPRLYVQSAGKRCVVVREFDAELAEMHAIAGALGLADRASDVAAEGRRFVSTDLEAALAIVEAAEALGDRVELRWASARIRADRAIGSGALRLRVGSGAGYFSVGGDAAVDEATVALVDIVAAMRRGDRFVRIAPGRFARIADELRTKLASVVAASRERKGGELAVAAAALPFLGELVEGATKAKISKEIVERIAAWRRAGETSFEVPAQLRATLRPYQGEGFTWLARLASWTSGAVLADDMGLGKTLQSIALLVHRSALGPALVIAPTSVGPNWESELARFAPKLRVRVYRGAGRAEQIVRLGKRDVLVTSWDIAVRDEEALAAIRFATIVFDEAQAAKNAASRRAAMACGLQGDFRLALSGTPIENHLGELWSLFSFTVPGLLGTKEQFRERFATPIERDHGGPARNALASIVTPFILRRTKELVEKDLPSLTETTRWVELSEPERTLYEAMRREALASLEGKATGGKDHILFLSWLTRLRQLACHPRLAIASSTVASSKLASALEVVAALRAEGHRALVFSQFTEHLALLRAELDAQRIRYQYLDGSTTSDARKKAVEAFQAGDGELFLLSLKAGGVGLNLTGAAHVLHLDPWWNPAAEDQATDRAHRIGQTKPVTAIRLVTRGTVEEAIVGVRERKRELAGAVLDGTDAAAKLSHAELLELLRVGLEAGD